MKDIFNEGMKNENVMCDPFLNAIKEKCTWYHTV